MLFLLQQLLPHHFHLTDEVTKTMSCGEAYCNNAQVVVVNKDVADKYQDVESLKELNFAAPSCAA